ncbi:hypothetical protein AAFF_G00267530 [Aldrovandia affinis]|uniref:Secreted protein n=1 Tax=Aldrovandia affinis TaxID=143900 RepID=A0AAD7SRY0_9TELE|nr:hypothetical protein AAFF_G00267530 [Aldrovandia affinis]
MSAPDHCSFRGLLLLLALPAAGLFPWTGRGTGSSPSPCCCCCHCCCRFSGFCPGAAPCWLQLSLHDKQNTATPFLLITHSDCCCTSLPHGSELSHTS